MKTYGACCDCVRVRVEAALSKIPVMYVDSLHDRWDAVPEFHSHL